MTSLDLAPSRQIITTATGSMYILTVDPATSTTLTRLPGAVLMHRMADGLTGPRPLRRDNEAIKVLQIVQLETGKPARFLLDVVQDGDIETFRITSPVISIEPLEVDQAD